MQKLLRIFSLTFTSLTIFGSFCGFWYGPWSPNLEHRARILIVDGQLEEGVDLFLWKAEYALTSKQRDKALWDAARLVSLRSDSMRWSKELLENCLKQSDFKYKADAHAQLAALLFEAQPREAIKNWEWALFYGGDHKNAVTWRVRLAMALEAEGNKEEAISVWEDAIEHPESARMAHMVLGRLLMEDNPDMSIHHFERAKQLAESDRERAAELGFELAQFELENPKFSK